jgi:pilus assembly protein Flp/PilA
MLFYPHERGQGLVEYGLILILVAIVVVAILTIFGTTIGSAYSGIVNSF